MNRSQRIAAILFLATAIGLVPVRSLIAETLTAQPTRDGVGQPQFVFGDQYAHRTSMTGAG